MRCYVSLSLILIITLRFAACSEMTLIDSSPDSSTSDSRTIRHRKTASDVENSFYNTENRRTPNSLNLTKSSSSPLRIVPGVPKTTVRLVSGQTNSKTQRAALPISGCVSSPSQLKVRCRGHGAASALSDVFADIRLSRSAVVLDELHLSDINAVVDVLRRQRSSRQDAGLDWLRVRRLILVCSESENDDTENMSVADSWTLAAGIISSSDLLELTTTGCTLPPSDPTVADRPPLVDGLSRLLVLRIRQGGLESLPFSATFMSSKLSTRYRSELRELELWGNRLASLDDWAFYGFAGLRLLDLDRNRLESIRRSTWTGLESLGTLRLSRNRLTTLPGHAFAELPRLRHLTIDANSLGFLHPAALYGLTGLVVLRLADNRVQFFADGAFNELPSLRRLDLAGNQLDRVWLGTFAGLHSLEWIDLSRNRLGRVPDGSFRNSASLGWIRLDWNKMSGVLRRCALSPARRHHLRSLSMLGNRVRCDGVDHCQAVWSTRTSHDNGDHNDDLLGDAWKVRMKVWGGCLTNKSDGTSILEAFQTHLTLPQTWCSVEDCDN